MEDLGDGQNPDQTSHSSPSWRPLATDYLGFLLKAKAALMEFLVKPLMTNSVVKAPYKLGDQVAVL